MESIVLHADSAYMVSVDNFVRAICDINHISNYYATILVAVQEAVEHVVAFGKVNQPIFALRVFSSVFEALRVVSNPTTIL